MGPSTIRRLAAVQRSPRTSACLARDGLQSVELRPSLSRPHAANSDLSPKAKPVDTEALGFTGSLQMRSSRPIAVANSSF